MIVVDTGPLVAAAIADDRYNAVATLDRRHFSVVRPRHISAFTLLPG